MWNLLRSRRLTGPGGAILMAPLDHGVSSGPIAGLESPAAAARAARDGGATCLAVHRGLVPVVAPEAGPLGILLHLSASTDLAPDPLDKRLVATIDEAVRLGCDGVSLHVNLGSPTEARQIEEAGRAAAACGAWGMPLVAMLYARGPAVRDPHDPRLLAHAARLGAELGADAVKVPFTGREETFRDVVSGCPVPVLVAGGPRRDSFASLVEDLKAARRAGARGASVGRNVFQQPEAARAMRTIADVFA